MRHIDRAQVRCARLSGTVQAVQDMLMLNPEHARQLASDWPELHAKLTAAFRINRGED